jgi:FKBP12-rapamycin complex-associated protein
LQSLQLECHRRKQLLAEKWRKRIRGCASSGKAAIPVWKYLLNGRRMVLNEREDLDTWLEFASLCRHGGNHDLAERVLQMTQKAMAASLGGTMAPPASSTDYLSNGNASGGGGGSMSYSLSNPDLAGGGGQSPEDSSMEFRIRFAMLKQKWAVGAQEQALGGLDSLLRSLGRDSNRSTDAATHHDCLLKLGEWKMAMVDPGQPVDPNTRRDVLALYSRATLVLPSSYRAWHQWGLSNYRAIEEARGKGGGYKTSLLSTTGLFGERAGAMSGPNLSPQGQGKVVGLGGKSSPRSEGGFGGAGRVSRQIVPSLNTVPVEVVAPLAVNTVKGLMRAISLGTRRDSSSVMEDMLCVLSTWFRYGRIPDVCAALEASLTTVHLDNWLGVLPQLIARIDHPEPNARRLLHGLLTRLGAEHSQAMVYPLSVALKSP